MGNASKGSGLPRFETVAKKLSWNLEVAPIAIALVSDPSFVVCGDDC